MKLSSLTSPASSSKKLLKKGHGFVVLKSQTLVLGNKDQDSYKNSPLKSELSLLSGRQCSLQSAWPGGSNKQKVRLNVGSWLGDEQLEAEV